MLSNSTGILDSVDHQYEEADQTDSQEGSSSSSLLPAPVRLLGMIFNRQSPDAAAAAAGLAEQSGLAAAAAAAAARSEASEELDQASDRIDPVSTPKAAAAAAIPTPATAAAAAVKHRRSSSFATLPHSPAIMGSSPMIRPSAHRRAVSSTNLTLATNTNVTPIVTNKINASPVVSRRTSWIAGSSSTPTAAAAAAPDVAAAAAAGGGGRVYDVREFTATVKRLLSLHEKLEQVEDR